MDVTCNGFTSQKCPRKLCAPHCRSAGYCNVHKKAVQPAASNAAPAAHLNPTFVTPGTQAPQSRPPFVQDSSTSDEEALATAIQMSLQSLQPATPTPPLAPIPPSAASPIVSTPARARPPIHSHQMSRMWSQMEVELNGKELARKERERKKAQAHLESKQNLDVVSYDQVHLYNPIQYLPSAG
jgi:hypothetical protein